MRFHLVTLAVARRDAVRHVCTCSRRCRRASSRARIAGSCSRRRMGPQDMSFDYMAKHTHAIGEIVRKHPEVDDVGVVRAWSDGINSGIRVRAYEAARTAAALGGSDHRGSAAEGMPPSRVCSPSCRIRRRSQISGQRQRERVPAHAAERRTCRRSISGRRSWWRRCGRLPGFVDVNSPTCRLPARS